MIIDWATAARGNPVADLALTSLILRLGDPPPGTSLLRRALVGSARRWFHDAYVKQYVQRRSPSPTELVAWQLPVAAARLAAGIARERRRLLEIIDAASQAQRDAQTTPRTRQVRPEGVPR